MYLVLQQAGRLDLLARTCLLLRHASELGLAHTSQAGTRRAKRTPSSTESVSCEPMGRQQCYDAVEVKFVNSWLGVALRAEHVALCHMPPPWQDRQHPGRAWPKLLGQPLARHAWLQQEQRQRGLLPSSSADGSARHLVGRLALPQTTAIADSIVVPQ